MLQPRLAQRRSSADFLGAWMKAACLFHPNHEPGRRSSVFTAFGARVAVTVSDPVFYDPEGSRLRA